MLSRNITILGVFRFAQQTWILVTQNKEICKETKTWATYNIPRKVNFTFSRTWSTRTNTWSNIVLSASMETNSRIFSLRRKKNRVIRDLPNETLRKGAGKNKKREKRKIYIGISIRFYRFRLNFTYEQQNEVIRDTKIIHSRFPASLSFACENHFTFSFLCAALFDAKLSDTRMHLFEVEYKTWCEYLQGR